ncbi:hypothetical protein GCM10027443_22950 [Pontibacter brevis]
MDHTAGKGLFSSLQLTSPEQLQELLERFRRQLFTVREAGITAKRFHGWHKAGLLPFNIPEGRVNLLTFPDYIWVRLIDRLRQLGMPLKRIKELKGFLYGEIGIESMFGLEDMGSAQVRQRMREVFEQVQLPGHLIEEALAAMESGEALGELSGYRIPLLETVLLTQLVSQEETGVLVFPDGQLIQFFLWTKASGEPLPLQTHLYLSITDEVREYRMNKGIARKVGELDLPTPQERQVLEALRDRTNRCVTVTFTDKGGERQMDLVTTRREEVDEETKRSIVELLRLNGYNEVVLKTSNGELVFSERSKRKRL